MPDDTNRRQPEDPKRINLNQSWEIQYWTKELNVSEAELRRAVKAVGDSIAAVKQYLKYKQ